MRFMEESLDLTLRELIPIVQHRIMNESSYFGIRTWKNPIDFWVYQELLYELKPDAIVEIGNYSGGSALAIAHLCDCMDKGRVIGVDLSHSNIADAVRNHPRITLIEGDACDSYELVARTIEPEEGVLVIEDSSHIFENTLRVLQIYSRLVKPGGYFIVEDGVCHHGLNGGPSPGPYEAVEHFVRHNDSFEIDRSREPFLITWNPKGYLRRIS